MQRATDARVDSLRGALEQVFAGADYRWTSREDPLGPLRRAWRAVGEALERLRADSPLAYDLLVWLLVALLLAVLAHAAWVTVRTVRGGGARASDAAPVAPIVVRDAPWYAAEAARLAARGDFVAAMQADYLRLVLELDDRRLVAYHPSKTPSEYVREATLSDAGRGALRDLVARLYRHAFARLPLDRDAYDAWRRDSQVERYVAAA